MVDDSTGKVTSKAGEDCGLKDQPHHDNDHAHNDRCNSLTLHGFSSFDANVPTPKFETGISLDTTGVNPLRAARTD